MAWKTELEQKAEEAMEDLVHPEASAPISAEDLATDYPISAAMALVGRINGEPFCGVPAGHLLFEGPDVARRDVPHDASHVVRRFRVRRSPWNHFRFPDGSMRELKDANGESVYPAANFDEIP